MRRGVIGCVPVTRLVGEVSGGRQARALTAVSGLVGGAVESLDSLFVVSGVASGVSFIGAGVRVWAEAGSTAPKTQSR
jgi:hypothetical protein